jgi:hypothetical protein
MSAERCRGREAGLLPKVRAAMVLLALAAASCTSSQTSLTAPDRPRCGVTVANSLDSIPAGGGAGSLTVSAARDCTWAASNAAQWVVLTSASSGQGDGSIAYRVAANTAPSPRRATIEVNTASLEIVQEAAECRFTVAPTAPSVAAAGGNVTIQVQTAAACTWTATTEATWVRITSGAAGQGDGGVALSVEANASGARTARLVVAQTEVLIEQAGVSGSPPPLPPAPAPPPGCTYTIQPGGQTVAAAGGPGTVDVSASAATCSWTAVSTASWITITGGASGTGSGKVSFNVASNAGASRTGTISVAGQTFTLTQAGASCSYSINPSSQAMAAAGGTATVGVSSGGSCAWTAAANAAWITIASGSTGTGSGTVRLNVAQNTGAARTGTATIAAQTFTVSQAAAPCGFSLSPATVDMTPAGGEGRTTVSAGAGCAWTAVSNAGWITVTAGSSGTGGGVVVFNAAANAGAARSGTITIGGQTLTVTQQPAPCTFSISSTAHAFPSAGGSGSVGVTTAANCGWTALSNNGDWLTILEGSVGTGSGNVSFAASPNPGPARTGSLTVAGHAFTVTQDAPCMFSIAPTSQTMAAAGGPGSVSVTAGGSCAWTAVSANTDWLTVTGGSTGTGNGQVSFTAAANATGADRSGTIAIAGQTFTLTQTAQ